MTSHPHSHSIPAAPVAAPQKGTFVKLRTLAALTLAVVAFITFHLLAALFMVAYALVALMTWPIRRFRSARSRTRPRAASAV